jgi:hypothetical protein
MFTAKRDGSCQKSADYYALDVVTIKMKYHLPRIDDLFDQVNGAKMFSNIDLGLGYSQIRVQQKEIRRTTFSSRVVFSANQCP